MVTTRRRKEVYIRKLIRLGKVSSAVVLPKSWIETQNLRPGDQVYIREREDGVLEISPAIMPMENLRRQVFIIYADKVTDSELLKRLIIGAYTQGLINIRVARSDLDFLSNNIIELIHKLTSRFDEVYIKRELRNLVDIEVIHSEAEININEKIAEMFMHLYSEIEHLARALETKERKHLEEVLKIEELIDRYYYKLLRRIILIQRGRLPAEKHGLESILHVIGNRRIIGIIEMISDLTAEIAKELMEESIDMFDERILSSIKALLDAIRKTIPDTIRAFSPPDFMLAHDVLQRLGRLETALKSFRKNIEKIVTDVKKAVYLVSIITKLVDTTRLFSGVCEVIINRAIENPEQLGANVFELISAQEE